MSRFIFNSRNDENAGSDNMMLSKNVILQSCIKMLTMSFIARAGVLHKIDDIVPDPYCFDLK